MINNHSHSGLGGDGEKINYNNLKNKPTSSGGGSKVLNFSRLASVGAGNQSFSGFGFTPTNYHITAWRDGDVTLTGKNLESLSHGAKGFTGTEQGVRIRPNSPTTSQIEMASTTYSINVDFTNITNGLRTRANFVSFDSDGITLNFVDSGENIKFILTCYS